MPYLTDYFVFYPASQNTRANCEGPKYDKMCLEPVKSCCSTAFLQ